MWPHQSAQPQNLLRQGQQCPAHDQLGDNILWCFPGLFSSLHPLPTTNTRLGAHKTNRAGFRPGRRSQSLTATAERLRTLSGFEAGDVWPYKDTSVFNPCPVSELGPGRARHALAAGMCADAFEGPWQRGRARPATATCSCKCSFLLTC